MWAQLLLAATGIWMMTAPDVLGYDDAARTSNHIAGPLLVSIGVIAASQILRGVRWAALPIGVWLILAPWLLGFPLDATLNSTAVGCVATGLSLVRGTLDTRFGGGWMSLLPGRKPHPGNAAHSEGTPQQKRTSRAG